MLKFISLDAKRQPVFIYFGTNEFDYASVKYMYMEYVKVKTTGSFLGWWFRKVKKDNSLD